MADLITKFARGARTGHLFYPKDISDPQKRREMASEPLWREGNEGQLVVPVNGDTPHFRRLARGAFARALEQQERSEQHKQCIEFMARLFASRRVRLTTPTFDQDVRTPDGRVLAEIGAEEYRWWTDQGGTRIPVGNSCYIQPDLCGRQEPSAAFHSLAKQPNVIIEVVLTHPPEQETFRHLLHLSECNHIVGLHFISRDSYGSRFSRLIEDDGVVTLRCVYWLVDGGILKNGEPFFSIRPGEPYAKWYKSVLERVLNAAIAG